MHIPHTFPSLLNPDAVAPVLFIGAGMSYGLVPSPVELSQNICGRFSEVEKILGITIHQPATKSPTDLYNWADDVLNALPKTLSQEDANLRMAEAIGVLSDRRFYAKVGLPLRGNTPRHRIAARFAREGRWDVIWSLNWDCIMEAALESVGLLPDSTPGVTKNNPLPWRRWYSTWSPGDNHAPSSRQPCTLHLIKPHGCINKLAKGHAAFVVSTSQLNALPTNLNSVNNRVRVVFSDSPLTVVGWSAEETYIHNDISAVKNHQALCRAVDCLSVIDPYWRPTPPQTLNINHNRLASAFNCSQADCHFPASSSGNPTTDQFFQWLQTLYGLERLESYARANAQNNTSWNNKANDLSNVKAQFPEPMPTDWLNSFFDDFLPVWVRLCCNAGKVIYKQNAAPIQPHVIATHRRDEHIPLGYSHSDREDLLAIIPLILELRDKSHNPFPWGFDEFPGAFWNEIDGHLVIPLPAWGANNLPIELAAVRPLAEGWNWSRRGIIHKISILPLLPQPSYGSINDNQYILRNSLAQVMRASKFSNPHNIGVIPHMAM